MNPAIVDFICGPTLNWMCGNAACIQVIIGLVWATFACSRKRADVPWDWDLWAALQVIWLVVAVLPTSLLVAVLFGG